MANAPLLGEVAPNQLTLLATGVVVPFTSGTTQTILTVANTSLKVKVTAVTIRSPSGLLPLTINIGWGASSSNLASLISLSSLSAPTSYQIIEFGSSGAPIPTSSGNTVLTVTPISGTVGSIAVDVWGYSDDGIPAPIALSGELRKSDLQVLSSAIVNLNGGLPVALFTAPSNVSGCAVRGLYLVANVGTSGLATYGLGWSSGSNDITLNSNATYPDTGLMVYNAAALTSGNLFGPSSASLWFNPSGATLGYSMRVITTGYYF